MKHLSTAELNARLDGALAGQTLEEAERHLAGCAVCRASLEALAAQDEALRPMLSHDPGVPYFDRFAARVEARLRAGDTGRARMRPEEPAGLDLGRWFRSPRSLAWIGSVAGLIVVAGVVLMLARENPEQGFRAPLGGARAPATEPSTVGPEQKATPTDEKLRRAEKAVTPARNAERDRRQVLEVTQHAQESGTPTNPSEALDRERAAAQAQGVSPRADANPPARLQEMRRTPNGEEVPVGKPGAFRFAPVPAPRPTGPGLTVRAVKPQSTAPLTARAPKTEPVASARPQNPSPPVTGPVTAPTVTAAPPHATAPSQNALSQNAPSPNAATPPSGGQARSADVSRAKLRDQAAPAPSAASGAMLSSDNLTPSGTADRKLCGEVRDPAGRPLSGVHVVVTELGRTATTGADGAFCLDVPVGHWTLNAMAIGYQQPSSVRAEGGGPPIQLRLEPVSVVNGQLAKQNDNERLRVSGGVTPPTLEENQKLPAFATPPPQPGARAKEVVQSKQGALKPSHVDPFAALPDEARALAQRAQSHASDAGKLHSPALFDNAASEWEAVVASSMGGPLEAEMRFHAAEARFHAWELAKTPGRRADAIRTLQSFLAAARAGGQRDRAGRWLSRVQH